MRKFLALLFTTVLATGAVQSAIAEETTIVEDPKNYIHVKQVKSNSLGADATNLVPSMGADASRTYFDLEMDIISGGSSDTSATTANSLRRAFVCLYDSSAATTEAAVDSLCGHSDGADATVGTNNSAKALQIRMDITSGGSGQIATDPNYSNSHVVQDTGGGATTIEGFPQNVGTPAEQFRGDVSDIRSFTRFTASFALSHAANYSAAWKVRVVADYNSDAPIALAKFTDDKTYTVNWFGAFGANGADEAAYERRSVNYGEIFDFSTKPAETGIATGSYYANGSSNISLSGTPFTLDTVGTEVPLADSVPFTQSGETFTGTNEFGLECKSGLETPIFVQAASKTLLPGVDASNTQVNVEDPLTADTHDCTLSYGTGAALGSYTNAITVGLGPVSE